MLQLASTAISNTLLFPSSFPPLMKNKNKKKLSLGRKDKLPAFWWHYLQLGTAGVNAAWPENFSSQCMIKIIKFKLILKLAKLSQYETEPMVTAKEVLHRSTIGLSLSVVFFFKFYIAIR